jgi:hypothetical protein
MSTEKKCANCGEVKPLIDFYKDKREKDGRYSSCKACHRVRMKRWRSNNPEVQRELSEAWSHRHPDRVAAYNKRYRERNPEVKRANVARYRGRYPEKVAAQVALRAALARGDVKKPDYCQDCSECILDPVELHGHHADYSKPFEVEWLCRGCHMVRHYPNKPRPGNEKKYGSKAA